MTHRIQNLGDHQSRLHDHVPAEENNRHLSAMMDMILKDLLVFGSAVVVVSVVLYLIF